MATAPATEVARILRVDHAGERGAIAIYSAQILISRWLWPDLLPSLVDMRLHEQRHFSRFDQELKSRRLRHCYALPLWSLGGWLLGLVTALFGRRAIWACTAAAEDTVCRHLQEQIAFLRLHDAQALAAVSSIQGEEQEHLDHALVGGGERRGSLRLIWLLVGGATALAMALSWRL